MKQLENARHAIHRIESHENITFNAEDYSKFKFGDFVLAKEMGANLFEYFKANFSDEFERKANSFLIYSSPYDQIPTSSYYMAEAFFEAFDSHIKVNGHSALSIKLAKIKRNQTYSTDYGALSAADRYNLISRDTYQLVDKPTIETTCVFIDDISVTGSHQRVVENTLNESACTCRCIFLYYAKVTSGICPSIENDLNYAYINCYSRFQNLLFSPQFKPTTRSIKYILSLNLMNLSLLRNEFRKQKRMAFLKAIVQLSYANKYNLMKEYQTNLHHLENELRGVR